MSRFINSKYALLEAYTPGEQPRERKYIKLNTNESPYPPSAGVINAVCDREVAMLNLYPDPTCKVLKEKLAALYGVGAQNVFVSNGSDDILNFSFMAFCNESDRPVKFPEISYAVISGFVVGSLKDLYIGLPTGWMIPISILTLTGGFALVYAISLKDN